jgi:hypothetical protein
MTREERFEEKCYELQPLLQDLYVKVDWSPARVAFHVAIWKDFESYKEDPAAGFYFEDLDATDCMDHAYPKPCERLKAELDTAVAKVA